MADADPRLTLAVCAFNEEANIQALLEALLADADAATAEVLVVSSGSTDRTNAIVAAVAQGERRLRLIQEATRLGKVAAVNVVLREARGEAVVLADGDCLPGHGALSALLSSLAEATVGGVGSRNVATNAHESAVAAAAAAMWELHHLICLRQPVLGGDIIAFRRVVQSLGDAPSVNDDFLIESELRRRGYTIAYQPAALTLMRVPASLADFIRQRRRIHYGFLQERRAGLGTKATQGAAAAGRAAIALLRREPRRLPALCLLAVLDTAARILAYADAVMGRGGAHSIWTPASTTKRRMRKDGESS